VNECRINRVAPGWTDRFRHRFGGADRNRHSHFVEAESSLETKEAMNLKEILVPMDFTDCSFRALKKAIPLAQQLGAKIVLLHVIDVPHVIPMGPASEFSTYVKEMRSGANRKFGELLPALTKRGVVFETAVVDGITHQGILDFTRKRGIEIIILGERKGKFWEFFRRHTAKCIREKSPCLVQVVCDEKPSAENPPSESECTTLLV
jgi:nucleotide-binding universal stress UspA family protein